MGQPAIGLPESVPLTAPLPTTLNRVNSPSIFRLGPYFVPLSCFPVVPSLSLMLMFSTARHLETLIGTGLTNPNERLSQPLLGCATADRVFLLSSFSDFVPRRLDCGKGSSPVLPACSLSWLLVKVKLREQSCRWPAPRLPAPWIAVMCYRLRI